jgi:hypothetical protein
MKILANVAQALQTVFHDYAEEVNEEVKAVIRRRKFTPASLAESFILALLAKPESNGEDIALMAAACGVSVSPQAVEQRYSQRLCDFFRLLLTKMVGMVIQTDEAVAEILERFTEVRLIDSSSIQLPDCMEEEFPACGGRGSGGRSVMKLQTELDLRGGQITCIQPEPGKSPDQGTERQKATLPQGSLRIADLGYFSIPVLRMIHLARAYFLTRIQHTIKIRVEEKKHSLVEWLNRQETQVVDQMVELGSQHRLSCRLIAWRVPPEIANRRRAKQRAHAINKTGRQPSAASLAACDWEFLVTNLTAEQLTIKEAIVLYRSRWQIELLFKRWKSYCQIDRLDGRNDIMTMTRLWARLCGAVVQHWLIVTTGWSPMLTLSFDKLAKLIPGIVSELASNLTEIPQTVAVLFKLKKQATIRCKRTKRKKRPGTIELLRDPELLDYALT